MTPFQKITARMGKKLWLIEQQPISEHQKENLKRKLGGLPPITKQQFVNQEKYYRCR